MAALWQYGCWRETSPLAVLKVYCVPAIIYKQKKANKHRMELHSCICYDDNVISPSHPRVHIPSAWKLAAGDNQIPVPYKAGQAGGFALSLLTYCWSIFPTVTQGTTFPAAFTPS